MSSRNGKKQKKVRAREKRHCERCRAQVEGKHCFVSALYNVLCRGCFLALSR
jgi:hypothetical protein